MLDANLRHETQDRHQRLLPLVSDYVTHHALANPRGVALIEHDTGARVTWVELERSVDAFAALLLRNGLRKGDVVATSLPFLKEHVFLMLACFRLGVIIAPLDLRLKAAEVSDAFAQVNPKAWFFLGKTATVDFRPMVEEVLAEHPDCTVRVQVQEDRDGLVTGARHIKRFTRSVKVHDVLSRLTGAVRRARNRQTRRDPCLIILTTGSTGSPKPALLCHENILVQNIGLTVGFGLTDEDRMLVNLPPSHVGGVTEQLLTGIYVGSTSVLLHIFDAEASLRAVEEHRVTTCGQIPALFQMEWRLSGYATHDLSSLRFAIYGGQAVDRPFLERLGAMAERMGTGLGLTETAGFCTYTPVDWGPDEVEGSLGFDSPLCPISVRAPLRDDGTAGDVLPDGQVGEVCFSGPQVFLGYMNDPGATARALSSDGILYTGDLGSYDERGLHFAGRGKFVMKPKGYPELARAEILALRTAGGWDT